MNKKTILISLTLIISCITFSFNLFKKKKSPYPSTNKSVELKITSPKKDFATKEIIIRNVTKSKKDIYVSVDCNYKTSKYGGGYERRTNAIKIRYGSQSTLFSFYPKEEVIAIRWTSKSKLRSTKKEHIDQSLRTATWYETQYTNYKDKKQKVSIDILEDGKYLYPGKKAKILYANKLIFVKAGEAPPRPTRKPRPVSIQ